MEAQFDITLPAAYFNYLAEIHAIDISPAWFPVTYSNGSTEWASVEAMYCLDSEICNNELPRAIAFYRNDSEKKSRTLQFRLPVLILEANYCS